MSAYINNKLYIPIIKWQKNERLALEFLEEQVKQSVLPCFEIRNSDQHAKLIECFKPVWNAAAIVDYSNPQGLLTTDRITELCEFLQYARENSYPIIPALNPVDLLTLSNKTLTKSLSKLPAITFRLRAPNFQLTSEQLGHCHQAVASFSTHNQHLIIDFGQAPTETDEVNFKALGSGIGKLKSLGFKSIHFISGAFPNDLSSVKDGPKSFPRYDLDFWNQFKLHDTGLAVGYGDYGILSPGWSEETLIRRGRVAIRYTCANFWFVLRGSNATKAESIALSELLLAVYEDIFKGEKYSWGDKIIADRASPDIPDKKKKAGGYHFAEAWNHHIAFVVKDD